MSENDSDSTSTSQGNKLTNLDNGNGNGDTGDNNAVSKDDGAESRKRPRHSKPSGSSAYVAFTNQNLECEIGGIHFHSFYLRTERGNELQAGHGAHFLSHRQFHN